MNLHSMLDCGAPLSVSSAGATAPSSHASLDLPAEVALLVLDHFEWGDLARMAAVQKSWSNIMYAVAAAAEQQQSESSSPAEQGNSKQWQLAQALLYGTHGLQVHSSKAMEMLLALANVEVDPCTQTPVASSSNTQQPCFAPAMRLIADLYLNDSTLPSALDGSATSPPSSSSESTSSSPSRNVQRGVQWLQSAFELGQDVDAAHEMALLYERGARGVDHDVVLAAQWLERAAQAGHTEAMAELGLCYELGCGVEQSDERALDWYMRAANQGSLVAKFSVGEAFEEARGVPQSHEEACLWYYKAAMEGDEDAKTALRRLRDIARIVLPGVSALLDG